MNVTSHVSAAFAKRIASFRQPLLVTHSKPDGDALGALLAAAELLHALGASPMSVIFDPVPDRYRFLTATHAISQMGTPSADAALERADGLVILDTCARSQLEPLMGWLQSSTVPKLGIDHHKTRDDLVDDLLTDERAAATCVLIYELARAAGWSLSPNVATALFVGVATDTGWFRHSNTDARTFAVASQLVELGVNASDLYQRLYLSETRARFRLRAYAAAHTEFHFGDRLAIVTIPRRAFDECGATMSDTEDLVNEPMQVASVFVSAMLVEVEERLVRVGLRSKPPSSPQDPDVDVAAFAAEFGGGGHARAAGVRLSTDLAAAIDLLLPQLRHAVGA